LLQPFHGPAIAALERVSSTQALSDPAIANQETFTSAVELLAHLRLSNDAWRPVTNKLAPRWIFRGQGNADWSLAPKLYRNTFQFLGKDTTAMPVVDIFTQIAFYECHDITQFAVTVWRYGLHPLVDTRIMHELRAFCDELEEAAYTGASPKEIPPSLLDIYALGQHHGLGTRLLDWTEDPLVALYFASQDNQDTEFCAVWAVEEMRAYRSHDMRHTLQTIQPPWRFNRNQQAQKGLFTIDPVVVDMEMRTKCADHLYYFSDRTQIRKIVFPSAIRREVLDLLSIEGIHELELFPNLDNARRFAERSVIAGRRLAL
jgi:FRG domain